MPYNGPLWVDGIGGTNLSPADLNTAIPSPTAYVQVGGLPSAATSVNPPVITQPATQAVLLPASGAPPVWVNMATTTVPCGAGGAAQDNYVDLTPGGTYVVTTGASGFTPGAVTAGNLRLYVARTNAGNSAVTTFTLLAPTTPAIPAFLQVAGMGAASTVSFAGSLVTGAQSNLSVSQIIPGTDTFTGDLLVDGFVRHGPNPNESANAVAVTQGSAFADPGPLVNSPYHLLLAAPTTGPGGILSFTTNSTLPPSGAPYSVLQLTAIYSLSGPNPLLPYGFRSRVLTALLLTEVGTSISQPGLWVDTITPVVTYGAYGNGPNPQIWYYVTIKAKSLAPSTTYTFAYLPLFA
jgi:hypothetical protein